VRVKREKVADEDDEEMDIDDDDEAGPPAPATSNSTSRILFYCTRLNVYIDCPFSTSAALQQVAMFKPPTRSHKWCPGSIIPTVRTAYLDYFTIYS